MHVTYIVIYSFSSHAAAPNAASCLSPIERLNPLRAGHAESVGQPEFRGFHRRGCGKNVVGHGCRRCHVVFDHHVELERFEGLKDPLGVRERQQRVVG